MVLHVYQHARLLTRYHLATRGVRKLKNVLMTYLGKELNVR